MSLSTARPEELRDECASDLERLDNSAAAGPVNADDFFKPLKLALEGGGSSKARRRISYALSGFWESGFRV